MVVAADGGNTRPFFYDKAEVSGSGEPRGGLNPERAGAIKYGQSLLDISDEMHLEQDRARNEADRARDLRLAGELGIDAAMAQHRLDALLFAGSSRWPTPTSR